MLKLIKAYFYFFNDLFSFNGDWYFTYMCVYWIPSNWSLEQLRATM